MSDDDYTEGLGPSDVESEFDDEEYDEVEIEFDDDGGGDNFYDDEGDYEEGYEEGYDDDQIDYGDDDQWDEIQHEQLPDLEIEEQDSNELLKEDDPNDPITWDDAKRVYGESDSDDEFNADRMKEVVEAKVMENRKAILIDPFHILKPKQIVDKLNNYKRKRLDAAKRESNGQPIDLTALEKVIEKQIEDTFCPTGENFNSDEYFLAMHCETSFQALKQGTTSLRTNLQQNTLELKQFVQKNIHRFVTCKDTIDVIGEQIEHNELSSDRGTRKLVIDSNHVTEKVDELYGPIFQRKSEAEKLTKKIQVIEKYKFLLNLPKEIKAAIEQGDYDKALRDYQKAQEFISESQTKLFDSIMKHVAELIDNFQTLLFKSLEDPGIPLVQQKKTIKYLGKLKTPQDPFWYFLKNRQKFITSLMCPEEVIDTAQFKDPILYNVKRLSGILVRNLPELWSLSNDFFSYKVESTDKAARNKTRDDINCVVTKVIAIYISEIDLLLLQPPKRKSRRSDIKSPESRDRRATVVSSPPTPDMEERKEKKRKIERRVKDPRECLLQLISCRDQLNTIKELQEFIEPISDFIDTISNSFVNKIISMMTRRINKIEMPENWTEYEIVDKRSILAEAEDIIVEFTQMCASIFSDKKLKKNYERILSSGLVCFLKKLDNYLFEQTHSNHDPIMLSFLRFQKNSRTSNSRIGAELSLSLNFEEEYETLVKEFEKKIMTRFCDEKVQIVNQILRDGFNQLMKSKTSKNKQVSDYLMNILLELVIIHSEIFVFCPSYIDDILSFLVKHFLTTFLHLAKAENSDILLTNYHIAFQVMVDLQFFLQICQNYENKEIQNITSNSMETFNLVFDHLKKPIRDEQPLIANILATTIKKTKNLFLCFSEYKGSNKTS